VAFAPRHDVLKASLVRAIAAMLAFQLTDVAAFGQGRILAPEEARWISDDYVLTPMAKELRRRCTCVSAAFAEPRVAPNQGVSGPGQPLRHVDLEGAIRSRLERPWRDLVEWKGVQALRADARTDVRWGAATILVTGRGFGRLQGRDAIRAGVQLYTLAAQAGHEDAQADLAYLYMTGLGVLRSDAAAAHWYLQGAVNGSHVARLALGAMYAVGRGVDQNDEAAVYWFAQAKQHRFVADAYACGFGVDQDLTLARKLYEELAEKGDVDAQFQLATMLSAACGAPLDDAEAARWYEEAAQDGHPEAQIALSHLTRQGLGVAPNPVWAYQWAEVAVLRLQGDEARGAALAARAAAGALMTPGERTMMSEFARDLVKASHPAPDAR
jgi:TPR repeat protein